MKNTFASAVRTCARFGFAAFEAKRRKTPTPGSRARALPHTQKKIPNLTTKNLNLKNLIP